MLLVEPTFNTDDRREKMCELAFEQFETPAVFIAKDSVLAA
jgi:actin-related protein